MAKDIMAELIHLGKEIDAVEKRVEGLCGSIFQIGSKVYKIVEANELPEHIQRTSSPSEVRVTSKGYSVRSDFIHGEIYSLYNIIASETDLDKKLEQFENFFVSLSTYFSDGRVLADMELGDFNSSAGDIKIALDYGLMALAPHGYHYMEKEVTDFKLLVSTLEVGKQIPTEIRHNFIALNQKIQSMRRYRKPMY